MKMKGDDASNGAKGMVENERHQKGRQVIQSALVGKTRALSTDENKFKHDGVFKSNENRCARQNIQRRTRNRQVVPGAPSAVFTSFQLPVAVNWQRNGFANACVI